MTSPEHTRQLEIEATKNAISSMLQTVKERSGIEFTETDIEAYLQKYLTENNKNILELTQNDWENIFSDFLIANYDKIKEATDNKRLSREFEDLIQLFEARGPVIPEIKKECTEDIAELEKMFDEFGKKHNIQELMAIEELGPQESPQRNKRSSAKADLSTMYTKIQTIKNETDISAKQLEEIRIKYEKFDQAVGMVNKGQVDHTRTTCL